MKRMEGGGGRGCSSFLFGVSAFGTSWDIQDIQPLKVYSGSFYNTLWGIEAKKKTTGDNVLL